MNKPRILDLFSGAGGAARGYQLAGFYVVGVDIKPQPRYVGDEFYQADALEFVAEHGHEFDAIHASPPCQRYSKLTPTAYKANHPDLIAATRDALLATGKPYIIENVERAARLLINPIMVCGSTLDLNLWRHRYFETNAFWTLSPSCNHSKTPVLLSGTMRRKGQPRHEHSAAEKREASGLTWMTIAEMDEAIPPAYTEYLGLQLMAYVQERTS